MNKIMYYLKYNSFIIIFRLLISFILRLIIITINELAYYIKWLENKAKPSLRKCKKAHLEFRTLYK